MSDVSEQFKIITPADKCDKLDFISKNRTDFILWKKGGEDKFKFRSFFYDEKKSRLDVFSVDKNIKLENGIVAFHFEIAQVFYFGSGKIITNTDRDECYIELDETFYKSEKRINFRISSSELISFSLIINDKEYEGMTLSVGGMSLKICPTLCEYFETDKFFTNARLVFEKKNFELPSIKAIYSNMNNDTPKRLIVGISFIGLHENSEAQLFREINSKIYMNFLKNKRIS